MGTRGRLIGIWAFQLSRLGFEQRSISEHLTVNIRHQDQDISGFYLRIEV